MSSRRPVRRDRRRLALRALAAGFVVVVLELASAAVILLTRPLLDAPIRTTRSIYAQQTRMLDRWLTVDSTRRDRFDAELGWSYRRPFSVPGMTISAQGLRAGHLYADTPAAGTTRVAAFGDSFVFGMEAIDRDAWAWRLEHEGGARLEVLNYGVGGYGTDQSLLRYRAEGEELSPDIVLIGFVPVNLSRNVGRYRRFFDTRDSPWLKPRFILDEAGEPQLIPMPLSSAEEWAYYRAQPKAVRAFGDRDQWYEPVIYENVLYDLSATVRLLSHAWIRTRNRFFGADRLLDDGVVRPEAPAFRVTRALMREFAAEVRARGAEPVFVFFPDERSLRAVRSGGPLVYAPLADSLRSGGETVLDVSGAFARSGPGGDVGPWFMLEGHYSAEANRLVADWLRPRLVALGESAARE